MVTDIRRATVQGVRDKSGPATFAFGMLLVIVGFAGFLAFGRGELLGIFRVSMSLNVLHLAVGATLVSAAILGPRPARFAATGAGVLLLLLGLAALTSIGSSGADAALYLVLGIALSAVGRR